MAGATQAQAHAAAENVQPLDVQDYGKPAPQGDLSSAMVSQAEKAGFDPNLVTPQTLAYYGKQQKEEQAAKAKRAAEAKQTEEEKAREAQIQQVENSPWTQLGNALAEQYQQAETPTQNLISGAVTPAATSNAMSLALSSIGEGSSSGAAGWLSGEAAQAAQQTAPIAAAMNAQGQAYQAEAGPITKAIMAYGQANALEDITAPEAGWLNALASHVTSNLSYYGNIPQADVGALQAAPGVVSALQQAGGYAGGGAGSGLIPLNDLKVQNGQVKVVQPAAGAGLPALGGGGTIPAPASSAGG